MTVNIAIYLYDQIEVLDFAGPFEVFSTASRMHASENKDANPLFEVFTLSESGEAIHARGQLQVVPQYSIKAHPPIDLLIVPGGIVEEQIQRANVIQWIQQQAQVAKISAAICTGSFLFAQANLLDGRAATTHWEDIPDFERSFPDLDVRKDVRWVDTGDVLTSAGISAGIDMSLHLVERLASRSLAEKTARQMDFDWQDSGIQVPLHENL